MKDDQKQLRAIIHGHVQGVSFRYYTVQEAQKLGITGWVRNEPDNTGQVVAEGSQEQLDALIDFLHVGSPSANIAEIYIDWHEATGKFSEFKTAYHHD